MSEQLKQFIDQNRNAFDSEEPGSAVFKRIQSGISDNGFKKKPAWKQWGWAAAVSGILLLSAGYYFFSVKNNDGTIKPVVKEESPATNETNLIGDASYARQITAFREIIGLQQSELKQLEKEYPDLYRQLVTDINELDSSYQSLKIKLAENPNRELLLEAMIQNLQLQSDLLNRQLQIIKEIKQKNKSHEKSIS